MPVLRQVPRSEAKAKIVLRMYDLLFGDRDPVAEPGTATGTPGDWWTVFALAPDILQHAVDGFAEREFKLRFDIQLGRGTRIGAARALRLLKHVAEKVAESAGVLL